MLNFRTALGLANPTGDAVFDSQEQARSKITQRRDDLAAARAATRDRFVAALRTYFLEPLPDGLLPDKRVEIERLVRVISRFDTLTDTLLGLRKDVAAFDVLLRNMPKDGNSAFYRKARTMGSSIIPPTDRLLEAATGQEYPFDHARGKVLLSVFLVEGASHSDESIHAFLRAQALIDRFFPLYDRINGRLTQLALQAEQNVLSGMPQPQVAIQTA